MGDADGYIVNDGVCKWILKLWKLVDCGGGGFQ